MYYHHTLPNEKSRAQAMGPRSVQQGELAEVQANIRLPARTEAGADIQLAWASKSRCTGRLVTKHLVFFSKGQDQCLHAFQPVVCVCVYIYRLHIYICTPFHASHENEVCHISSISYTCMYSHAYNYLGHTDILKFGFVSCMRWLPS